MQILKPRLVVVTGISAVGKTSTVQELAKLVANAFVLDKDAVNQGSLHVSETNESLPPFKDYVAKDSVFPNYARNVETPFGEMTQVDPKNEFYRRHARDQAYLVMAGLARMNADIGKFPIIDCMVIRQIRDGTVRRFIEQPLFRGLNHSLIHFIADEEDSYQRHVARAKVDKEAAVRDKDKIASREAFHHFVTVEQPMLPPELSNYEHLVVNTSRDTPKKCAERCLDYIAN